MALLIVIFAYYCVRNTTQDLIYAITGRVPPSFIREQNRIARREARRPITDDRGHRKFFRNAYNDAWETAEEHRARWAGKRAQKRHAKWDAKDGVPTPIETNARPEEKAAAPAVDAPTEPAQPEVPAPVVHDDDTYTVGGKNETVYQRYAMRRRNGGQQMTTIAIADELGTTVTEAEKLHAAWAARYEQETNPDTPPKNLLEYQKHGRCRDCNGEVTLGKDPERLDQWIVGVRHTREDCPQNAKRLTPREQHDQQVAELAAEVVKRQNNNTQTSLARDMAERQSELATAAVRKRMVDAHDAAQRARDQEDWQAEATHLKEAEQAAAELGLTSAKQMADAVDAYKHGTFRDKFGPVTDRTDGTGSTDRTENDVTTETTGLQSGLAYNDEMAKTCEAGAASIEQSIAALENGEVGQSVTGPMQQAREHLEAAMGCFRQAHDELASHITIKEAYDANPDAGNKAFVTAE